MLKKILITLVILLALAAAGIYWLAGQLGLSGNMQANLDVATGLSAKLACSGYHLSGIPREKLYADIDSYAPISSVLRLGVNRHNPVTSATLLRNVVKTATYRPGLGCTLNIGDTTAVDRLSMPDLQPNPASWPQGNRVDSINPTLQQQLDAIVAADNQAQLQTRAMLVVHDGQVVAESYANQVENFTLRFLIPGIVDKTVKRG